MTPPNLTTLEGTALTSTNMYGKSLPQAHGYKHAALSSSVCAWGPARRGWKEELLVSRERAALSKTDVVIPSTLACPITTLREMLGLRHRRSQRSIGLAKVGENMRGCVCSLPRVQRAYGHVSSISASRPQAWNGQADRAL